mmetsp:Transcript_35871/g.55960  ORF Transcript_35871/g.55960 Transcript_35871/m.55960 type:complete len:114 (+) Transcript_35871:273-614(+)
MSWIMHAWFRVRVSKLGCSEYDSDFLTLGTDVEISGIGVGFEIHCQSSGTQCNASSQGSLKLRDVGFKVRDSALLLIARGSPITSSTEFFMLKEPQTWILSLNSNPLTKSQPF